MSDRLLNRAAVVCAFILATVTTGLGGDAAAIIKELRSHLRPDKPTVEFSYEMGYRFLYIQLMKVGTAKIQATEGEWLNRKTGETQKVCFMELKLNSMEGGDKSKRGRIYLDNHLVSVLTLPELDTLVHLKRTNEIMKPLFKSERQTDAFHMYEMEDGRLTYYAEDYLAGTVTTNLAGTVDLAQQGKAVSGALQILSGVYYGKKDLIDSDYEIQVDINGQVMPFGVETRDARIPVHYLRRRMNVLRVDVAPKKKEIEVKCDAQPFVVWGASFLDFADQTGNKRLSGVAASSLQCSMVPLQADFCVTLGRVRCTLVDAELLKDGVEGFKPRLPEKKQIGDN